MGNDGSKSSSSKHHHHHHSRSSHSKDDDEIELPPKPQRRMDKIRRSLSFRKKKKHSNSNNTPSSASQPPVTALVATSAAAAAGTSTTAQQEKYTIDTTKPTSWQDDERKVREGTCSFHVKYLGSLEVFDSRGMHICEQAIERLITSGQKKKPIKAILYVSGDSLRVVDETNKTLLVDQTIEKVSFCAPDRFHDNGFAYICRDGTTRRWLCHGFLAIKDTIRNTTSNSSGGERLSHAVGCAFSVCLERKQKRETGVSVTMEVGPNHSFTRFGSFRQASLTERLEDPQIVIPAADPQPIKRVDNPYAIERPKGNAEILSRQNSLRSNQGPFKRNTSAYTSLKPGELPSFQAQKLNSIFNKTDNVATTTTTATTTITTSSEPSTTDNKFNTISELPEENIINDVNSTIVLNPTPPPLPPLPQSLSYRSTTTTTSSQQAAPPPLPPLPVNISVTNQQDLFHHHHHQPQSPPLSAGSFWNQQTLFTTPQINGTSQQSSIFTTPQSPIYLPASQPIVYNNIYQTTPHQLYQQPIYAPTTPTTTTNTAVPANETFEAKWARLQATKKTTNPFAEDIAKKYEIKL